MWFNKKQNFVGPLLEKKHLPVGMKEFHEWSDYIIFLAGLKATNESQKYALSNMILHLGPTVDAESDAYFVKALRKSAANQVADEYRQRIYPEVKERLRREEEAKKAGPEVEIVTH